MKSILLNILFLSTTFFLEAQSIAELKNSLTIAGKKVQAIHHYPQDIKDGECHNVEITDIVINGNVVTITETWSNWLGKKANTVLTGKLDGDNISGEWKSNYSSGAWSYSFSKSFGEWNKSHSTFDSFKEWQKLEFRIVNGKDIRNGFFECR